jgi:ribosomal-protein-alanine N-acetyltransferase
MNQVNIMNDFPTIKGQYLTLRALTIEDVPAVFDIFSRDEVTEHYDCYSYLHESQASEQVRKWMASYIDFHEGKDLKGFRWAIAFSNNPAKLIGTCGIHRVSAHNKSFDIGYELHPKVWGRGIATQAISALVDYCFNQHFPFKVNRITAMTDVVSPRSISVLSKLGFQQEGILRESEYWKDRFNDSRLFSLLRRDWLANHNEMVKSAV